MGKKVIENVIWSRFILNLYVTFTLFPQKYPSIQTMVKYRKMCEEIIAVSEEIKKGTINRILEMSDEELAIAVLTGKLKMP